MLNLQQFESLLKNAKKARQELDQAQKNYDEACDSERAYFRANLHLDYSSGTEDLKGFANTINSTREKLNYAKATNKQAYVELLKFLRECEGHIIKLDLQGMCAEPQQLKEIFTAIDGNKKLVVSAINMASSACDKDFLQNGLPNKRLHEEKFESRKYVLTGFDQLEIVDSDLFVTAARLDKDQQEWLVNKIINLHNEQLFLPDETSNLSLDKNIQLSQCIGLFKSKTTLRSYLVDMVGKDITVAAALYNALTTPEAQPQLLNIMRTDAKGRKIFAALEDKSYKSELEIPLLKGCKS